jgi:hypothetical protein
LKLHRNPEEYQHCSWAGTVAQAPDVETGQKQKKRISTGL